MNKQDGKRKRFSSGFCCLSNTFIHRTLKESTGSKITGIITWFSNFVMKYEEGDQILKLEEEKVRKEGKRGSLA